METFFFSPVLPSTKSQAGAFLFGLLFMIFGCLSLGRAATTVDVSSEVIRPDVKRFGINLAQHNYYDSAQMMKELLFRNPGFEGLLYQSVVRLGPGGTASSALEDQPFTQWPSGFWAGASYEVIWSSTTAKGRTGTISNSLAPYRATGTPSDPNGSSQGTTYFFADSDPSRIVAEGDYLILRKTEVSGTGGGAAFASWSVATSGGGSVSSETVDLPEGTEGKQCPRLSALGSGQQASVSGQFDTLSGFVRLSGSFRLSFKAKGMGGANRLYVMVRRGGLTPYLSNTVQLGNGWAGYSLDFQANEDATTAGTVAVQLAATGQSEVLIDDVSLRQTDSSPSNPTEFRDAVVDTLQGLHPGILRYVVWQNLGDSLDNSIVPVFGRKRSGYSSYNTTENNMMPGLHEFLVLCEHLGADPWYCVPSLFSPQEAANLMEYLGGAIDTPYGRIRSQRGHPIPWTNVFSRIHLEFGNENWNNSAYRGASITSSVPLGNRASELFSSIKSSPYYSASQVQCILGGQPGNPTWNMATHNASTQHDVFGLAPYMAGRVDNYANNEELFGPLFAEPEWWSNNPSFTTGLMKYALNSLQSSSRPIPVVVYEVNLHTTQGAISQSALDSFTPSVGAGIAVADHMLTMLREVNARDQVFFSLGGHRYSMADGRTVPIWGSVLDMGKTNRKRPQYYAVQMLNDALRGDMIRTSHGGENPTWNVNNMNRVTYTGAHYLQSFAFKNGSTRALLVFNLHRTDSLNVKFTGPEAPAGAVTCRRLTSANITDNNESAEVVAPTTQVLNSFDPTQDYSLPPFSMTLLTWTQPARHAWRYQRFGTVAGSGDAADLADPDGDGIPNLAEYALGTHPLNGGDRVLPVQSLQLENNSRYLSLEIPKSPSANDVQLYVEVSSDLVHWSRGASATTILENNASLLRVRDNTPMEGADRRFIRLCVEPL